MSLLHITRPNSKHIDHQEFVYLDLHTVDVLIQLEPLLLLLDPNHAPSYLPSSSLSKADPGCSSESLPVFTSSEKAGPTPAPGWVTGGTAEGSSGLGSAQILASKGY
jgi:hypothetical protein